MRTKQKIDQDIESTTDSLTFSIEASIKDEQTREDYHKKLKKELKTLRAETSFEDTLAGQAQAFTVAVEQKIKVLLDELEQKTGVELKCNLILKQDESNT